MSLLFNTQNYMKKLFLVALLLLGLGVNINTYALQYSAHDRLEVNEVITDDVYTAAERIETSADIQGDLIAAAWEVDINSRIIGDLSLLAGEVIIRNEVSDDVRLIAWDVSIEADIYGDLLVMAWRVQIQEGVTIHGDALVLAEEFRLDGRVAKDVLIWVERFDVSWVVQWNAKLYIDDLVVSESASIDWDLVYENRKQITGLESITKGEVIFDQRKHWGNHDRDDWLEDHITGAVISIIGVLVLSALLYFYFENVFKDTAKKLESTPFKSALYGFLLVIGTPVVVILLIITIIGIPLGLLLLMLYIFMFVFAIVLNVVVITGVLQNRYNLDKTWKKVIVMVILSVLLYFVGIINAIIACFVLWAIMMQKVEFIKNIRK